MTDDKVKVTETSREYELSVSDLVPSAPGDEPTWYNKTACVMDRFRLIPRLIMLAYIYAFYASTTWFMSLSEPSNEHSYLPSLAQGRPSLVCMLVSQAHHYLKGKDNG
jgi:hypothetical protein